MAMLRGVPQAIAEGADGREGDKAASVVGTARKRQASGMAAPIHQVEA